MEKPNLIARLFGGSKKGQRGSKQGCCQIQIEEITETKEEEKPDTGSGCCAPPSQGA